MKILIKVSRILTGIVFVFSGFVKAVDPVGFQIKLGDYFEAMSLDFLMPVALVLAVLLIIAELVVGLTLFFNIFPKLSAWVALAFMLFFTPLTLWLAVANPVTDCGCFGDAIKLTNWQTFGKNVIILFFVLVIIFYRKKLISTLSFKKSIILTAIFTLFALIFQIRNINCLPIIDFRPFKIGVNIKEATIIPEGAKKDVYQTVLFYKNLKTGESKKFDINNIPYEDTLTWEYDTTFTDLVSKGYEPPIHDFFLTNLNGEDQTNKILNNSGTTYILILHNFEKGVKKLDDNITKLAKQAKENDISFYCFTSSNTNEIKKYNSLLPENIEICTGDYKMLKTFIRVNPSFVIIENAVIKDKMPYYKIKNIIKEFNK